MTAIKFRKVLPTIMVVGGLIIANFPLINAIGQSVGSNGSMILTESEPGTSVDCWDYFLRNGTITRRVCNITVNGILEKCKIVTDLSYYDVLKTCVPVPPPQGE